MMNKFRETSPSKTLQYLSAGAFMIVLFVAALIASWNKYVEMFEHDQLHFFESAILALLTFGLFIRYWIACNDELSMLTYYLDEPPTLRVKSKTYAVIILLAIFFGILMSSADRIIVYAALIVTYSLLDMWGSWQVLRAIEPLIDHKLATAEGDQRKIVLYIRKYYFSNPTLQRIVTIMFASWIALVFAIMARYEKERSVSYEAVAYSILILNIVISEAVIALWRKKRDDAIEQIGKTNE
jgi:hypothetical protein